MSLNVGHAIRRNEHFATALGWGRFADRIARHLGHSHLTNRELPEAVAQWQRLHRPPLEADGIIGPTTWRELRRALGLTPQIDVARAIERNRSWGRRLRWDTLRQQVAEFVGLRHQTPDESQFAEAVASWQSDHPPLTVDGILGLGTWTRMMRAGLNYTEGPVFDLSWLSRMTFPSNVLPLSDVVRIDGSRTAVSPRRPSDPEHQLRHDAQMARQQRGGQVIIYINGMATNQSTHCRTIRALSRLLRRQVTGIWNQSGNSRVGYIVFGAVPLLWVFGGLAVALSLFDDRGNAVEDLGECIHDYALPVSWFGSAKGVQLAAALSEEARHQFGRLVLQGNRAAVDLYDRLWGLMRADSPIYIIAHSQGNLILSNVLWVLQWVRRPRPMGRRLFVYALASPAPSWPRAPEMFLHRYSNQNDPVAWLAHPGSLMPGFRQQGAPGTEWSFRHLDSDWEYLASLPDAHDVGRDTSRGFIGYMGQGGFFEQISRDLGDIGG